MVTITDRAKAVLALSEEREGLLKSAEKCNAHTQSLIADFHRMMQETSDLQEEILEKIAAIDEIMKKILESR